ncbi:MAG: DUF1670 domain-containing protein [Polaromonas sp.]
MKPPPSRIVDYRRLARRNLPGLLRYKFLHEYGYDKGPVVVAAIVADICETVRTYYRREGDLEPGQLIYLAPAIGERAGRGKTIGRTRLVPVRLSIVADEDLEAIRRGLRQAERRIIRVRRLAREAHEQGGLLSERDIRHRHGLLARSGQPERGHVEGAGGVPPAPGLPHGHGELPPHKAAIIRLYLDGMLTPDIARRTYHSKEAVDRYTGIRAGTAARFGVRQRGAAAAQRHGRASCRGVPPSARRLPPAGGEVRCGCLLVAAPNGAVP